MKKGRIIGITVVVSSAIVFCLVLLRNDFHPRTDDATVRANLIQIAPEVEGRVWQLPVRDNDFVRKGDLLYEIDPRSYQYALDLAESEQSVLEQQIIDYRRRIAAQTHASEAAGAEANRLHTGVRTAESAVGVAEANVSRAEASLAAARSHLELARNDFERINPLLSRRYVTVQDVDTANTTVLVAEGTYKEALAALEQARRQQQESFLREKESVAAASAGQAREQESLFNIDRIETLEAARPGKAARVNDARVNLERTPVVAPFDAFVTNMNTSVGAYVHVGTPLFTLIDARTWWVVANYRESRLKHIPVGAAVEVYLLSHPERLFHGVVDSTSFGVFPEDGAVVEGLPDISRTLNWVHLSARFPVRIRILDPDPHLMRIGESAVTTVR
jgi:multidrug efflux system membrane fusion protein